MAGKLAVRSRSRRLKHVREQETLDCAEDPPKAAKEVLIEITKRTGVSKSNSDKLWYLNRFAKLLQRLPLRDVLPTMPVRDVLCCIRVCLFHEAPEIRAAGLRVVRYVINSEESLDAANDLHLPHLIARSLDISLDNQPERMQAIRLMRKIVRLCPEKFPPAFVSSLVSIANDDSPDRDPVFYACLATLCELAILNTDTCVKMGVVSALLRNLLDSRQPRITEALVATILFLLNHPYTRRHLKPKIDLQFLVAPFTDCHYIYNGEFELQSGEETEFRLTASKMALLSVLRSWTGMLHFCNPGSRGLQSIIDVLYLPHPDVRLIIVDIFYDLYRLPATLDYTDDFTIALLASDPAAMQETWKLCDGFISEEGKAILPRLGPSRPNLVTNYLSLLLQALVNAGLLEALADVITTSETTTLLVKASVLLGELLHMIHVQFPSECCGHYGHALPTLITRATSPAVLPEVRNRATTSVSYLSRLHALKKRGPVPCSLFLDQLVAFSPSARKQFNKTRLIEDTKLHQHLWKDNDDSVTLQAIKDSHVLSKATATSWDWVMIGAIFRWPDESLKRLEDSSHKQFVQSVVQYFKPTSKRFSVMDQNSDDARVVSMAGCHLMDFLSEFDEGSEGGKLLIEFLVDFGLCISQIIAPQPSADTIFSPSKMMSTLCQDYFLMIGKLAHTKKGRRALERTGILQYFLNLVSVTTNDCYMKLVISCLDYTHDGMTRVIFTKVLTAASENARLYATNFIRVLVRLQLTDFHKWGIELLVTQLYDRCRTVSLTALDILDEACDSPTNLESLINIRPSLLHLGDRGQLLLVRFLSLKSGFKFLTEANYLPHEMEKWRKGFNYKYVKIVEDDINNAFTRHQRGEDGNYQRRSSQKHIIPDVYVPPHLYGQLAHHPEGLNLLVEKDVISLQTSILRTQDIQTEEEVLHLKAAVWALGHIGSTKDGIEVLEVEQSILAIVKLAELCPVFSVRGTCFNALSLMAQTPAGADVLSRLGWESVRHHSSEMWPVLDYPSTETAEDNVRAEEDERELARSRDSSRGSGDDFETRNALYLSDDVPLTGLLDSSFNMSDVRFGRSIIPNHVSGGRSQTLPRVRHLPCSLSVDDGTLYHHRTMSEPQAPSPAVFGDDESTPGVEQSLYPGSSSSVHSSPQCSITSLAKASTKERNRSRSFTDTSSASATARKPTAAPPKTLRSVSNIEIVESQVYGFSNGSAVAIKQDHVNSNESFNKSRSDSCTDSTSGVGSSDSGTGRGDGVGIVGDHRALSPIASSTSLNTVATRLSYHSETSHKTSNRPTPVLRRVPSINRAHPSLSDCPQESVISHATTTPRDERGYAALRSLRRRRNVSDCDLTLPTFQQRLQKSRSLEGERDATAAQWLASDFHSLLRFKTRSRPSTSSHSSSDKSLKDPEPKKLCYMGLCLPVDVNMIFCMDENDDEKYLGLSKIDEQPTDSIVSDVIENGFDCHVLRNCLLCSRLSGDACISSSQYQSPASYHIIKDHTSQEYLGITESGSQGKLGSPIVSAKVFKARTNSSATSDATTPGSTSSAGSLDGGGLGHYGDGENSQAALKMKVLRLCSSFATQSAEQGLLHLKQKFPHLFHDLCLYSEVLQIMGQYQYRWTSRRFIQELFLDLTFDELYDDALHILNVNLMAMEPQEAKLS